MQVLIAEDDPISRRLIEKTLAKWGYDVVLAQNGQEAQRILRGALAPRLVILDWMMPGTDGLTLTREVRKRGNDPYTYIILLTAKSLKQDIIEGLDAGADDYITKPFDVHELKARLRAGSRIVELQSQLLGMRDELEDQATHDFLTGLPNRLLFGDRLTQKLAEATRHKNMLSMMFLDLDRFKLVNDALGHNVGDKLLVQSADRIKSCLRDVDTVARMGGDEFTIILSDIHDPLDASEVADRIVQSFSPPFKIDDHVLYVTTSIGISTYPKDGTDVDTLVRNADTAMYRAKEQGGNCYHYSTEMLAGAPSAQMKLENALRIALDKNEFVLHYQPKVNCKTGVMLGAEALVRWQHPEMGLLFPVQFIPLAEESGLVVPLGEWVLTEACTQNKKWQDEGLMPMEVAVNISVKQLTHGDFVATVKRVLEETGLNPEYLGLELTETTIMNNTSQAVGILQELRAMGVRVSIDDFGTGHSSLSYLKNPPMDTIKIDRSFLKNIASDPDNAAIAGAVIAMAHSMNLRVVAEGIETLEQLDFLRSLNCDEMQGYFISRPVGADNFKQIMVSEEAAADAKGKRAA